MKTFGLTRPILRFGPSVFICRMGLLFRRLEQRSERSGGNDDMMHGTASSLANAVGTG